MNDKAIIKDFQVDGILAQMLPHFSPRTSQIEMAALVQKTIRQRCQLVVEAGTGTGKTFAYLVPAIRSGRKLMISTASKALQTQLFHRDLPLIQQALQSTSQMVMLKGRQNYLCKQRLEQHSQAGMGFEQSVALDLAHLSDWVIQTVSGDISDCSVVPESSAVWPLVTSSEENCLGQTCPHYQSCFVIKARQQAAEADLVVINHHLFFADQQLHAAHHAGLLTRAEVLIFDEAHTLPEIAAASASDSLNSQQLVALFQDLRLALGDAGRDGEVLWAATAKLSASVQQLQQGLSGMGRHRANWQQAWQKPLVRQSVDQLQQQLENAQQQLAVLTASQRDPTLNNLLLRVDQYQAMLQQLQPTATNEYGYWYQATSKHFTLARTPFSIANFFQKLLQERRSAWIFTSATLSVDQKLDHFCQRMGLTQPRLKILPSPFNYQRQAILYVPRYLPEPRHSQGAQQLVRQLQPLLSQNPGGCLLLCTAYHRLHELVQALRQSMERLILVQGEQSKAELLSQLMRSGNAILVATYSFWQGIDIPGSALSCVIIDRLPFAHPDDPLLQTRCAHSRAQGGDPFRDHQIPEAIITLKQGVGRLIRTAHDRGIVVICDDRIVARSYGSLFLNSLPKLPRTRDWQQAIQVWS